LYGKLGLHIDEAVANKPEFLAIINKGNQQQG